MYSPYFLIICYRNNILLNISEKKKKENFDWMYKIKILIEMKEIYQNIYVKIK